MQVYSANWQFIKVSYVIYIYPLVQIIMPSVISQVGQDYSLGVRAIKWPPKLWPLLSKIDICVSEYFHYVLYSVLDTLCFRYKESVLRSEITYTNLKSMRWISKTMGAITYSCPNVSDTRMRGMRVQVVILSLCAGFIISGDAQTCEFGRHIKYLFFYLWDLFS